MRVIRKPACGLAALLTVLLILPLTSGCFAEPSPLPSVRDFLVAWNARNYDAAARKTNGDRQAVAQALADIPHQLDAASISFALGRIDVHDESAVARFTVRVDLGENGVPWEYASQIPLKRSGGDWTVQWSQSIIHPGLAEGQRLALLTESPSRASVLDTRGDSLLRKTRAEVYGIYPGAVRDRRQTLGELADATTLDLDRLLGLVRSARPHEFLPLVTVAKPDSSGLAAKLRNIGELRSREVELPLDAAMAAELVGKVGPATASALQRVGTPYQPGHAVGTSGLQLLQQRRLAGTPTVSVIAQDPAGQLKSKLKTWPGSAATPVRTTLDREVQLAAQRSLRSLRMPAGLVVMHAKTGEVLASANHRAGGRDIALDGRYPPGMTFSILSAKALVSEGQQITSQLPCPAEQSVDGQVFRNQPEVRTSSKTTFTDAFGRSCATAFAGLSGLLADGSLTSAARRFGIGTQWNLPVPSFSGELPEPRSKAELAAAMVGEGRVRMSPLAMAVIAGAVDSGTWRPPLLFIDPRQKNGVQAQPLEPEMFRSLQALMRRSVTHGAARGADLKGTAVYGVTATVPDPERKTTTSWFAGFRGPIAFALAVEGKANATKIAARFLREMSKR